MTHHIDTHTQYSEMQLHHEKQNTIGKKYVESTGLAKKYAGNKITTERWQSLTSYCGAKIYSKEHAGELVDSW